jgi:hypothetical protein
VVVAGDDLATELARELNGETIGERYPVGCLQFTDASPKGAVHVAPSFNISAPQVAQYS